MPDHAKPVGRDIFFLDQILDRDKTHQNRGMLWLESMDQAICLRTDLESKVAVHNFTK